MQGANARVLQAARFYRMPAHRCGLAPSRGAGHSARIAGIDARGICVHALHCRLWLHPHLHATSASVGRRAEAGAERASLWTGILWRGASAGEKLPLVELVFRRLTVGLFEFEHWASTWHRAVARCIEPAYNPHVHRPCPLRSSGVVVPRGTALCSALWRQLQVASRL